MSEVTIVDVVERGRWRIRMVKSRARSIYEVRSHLPDLLLAVRYRKHREQLCPFGQSIQNRSYSWHQRKPFPKYFYLTVWALLNSVKALNALSIDIQYTDTPRYIKRN